MAAEIISTLSALIYVTPCFPVDSVPETVKLDSALGLRSLVQSGTFADDTTA